MSVARVSIVHGLPTHCWLGRPGMIARGGLVQHTRLKRLLQQRNADHVRIIECRHMLRNSIRGTRWLALNIIVATISLVLIQALWVFVQKRRSLLGATSGKVRR